MITKPAHIAMARLSSQQVAAVTFTNASDLISYMGAVQAQDYAMAKWAIGLRTHGSTEKQIDQALDKGELIRTHILRPTWHIVHAEDIYWMLALSAQKIKALMKPMNKQLELTEKIFTKSNGIIEKTLGKGVHLTREELAVVLEKAKISTQANRLAHLLERAELEGITCSGKMERNKKTYALLSQRVPGKKLLNKDESLALLAKRYFISRGPATIEDFSWWSNLPLKDARQGLEMIRSDLNSERIDDRTYWFDHERNDAVKQRSSVYLLPAFDEFIISYKDRTASLAPKHHKKALTVNGIFHPVIILNGQVAGLWKRSVEKGKVNIETTFFEPHRKTMENLVVKEAKIFERFLEMPVVVAHPR